jgi:hypothetical protein
VTDLFDRLQAALADHYRIERELGSGRSSAAKSHGPSTALRANSADVTDSDVSLDSEMVRGLLSATPAGLWLSRPEDNCEGDE